MSVVVHLRKSWWGDWGRLTPSTLLVPERFGPDLAGCWVDWACARHAWINPCLAHCHELQKAYPKLVARSSGTPGARRIRCQRGVERGVKYPANRANEFLSQSMGLWTSWGTRVATQRESQCRRTSATGSKSQSQKAKILIYPFRGF